MCDDQFNSCNFYYEIEINNYWHYHLVCKTTILKESNKLEQLKEED